MGRRTTIEYQGKKVGGEALKFESQREEWNVYRTEDGTELRMKTVVADVVRLDLYKEDGDPIYVLRSTNLVSADIPEVLKKTSTEGRRTN